MAKPPPPAAVDADMSTEDHQNEGSASVSTSNGDRPRGHAMIFHYDELSEATGRFHVASITGGVLRIRPVYKGTLQSGETVAVKTLYALQDRVILHEIIMLSLLRHPNIVKMIGFSCAQAQGDAHGIDKWERYLVYEYLPSGSLHKQLHDPQSEDSKLLDWKTRMLIALGIARGLNHLHNEVRPPVIYGGLSTSKILLDEKFHPRLSNFRVAEFSATNVSIAVKSDVYAYGSILLELITGVTAKEINNGNLFDWLYPMKRDREKLYEAVDPQLEGDYERQSLCRAADVALMCIDGDLLIRPDMYDVVRAMNTVAFDAQRQVGR